MWSPCEVPCHPSTVTITPRARPDLGWFHSVGMKEIPPEFMHGPFTRGRARAGGVSKSMLQGKRFVRIHPGVWRHVDHEMSHEDRIEAARLALPARARTTGLTRLQQLGLDFGARLPVRYVIQREHHLELDGVFLHRTKQMPPTDDVGATPTAAFVASCATLRVIDAIQVGDWLLHRGHMTRESLTDLIVAQPWRRGVSEAAWALEHLDGDSRSLKESETRALITFAGLPTPRCNQPVAVTETLTILIDLWFEKWRCALEYEGSHHQTNRAQYVADIDRYSLMRRSRIDYRQVTKETLAAPRTLARMVHRLLVDNGYDGPPPDFGGRWEQLFTRLRHLQECRRPTRLPKAVSQDSIA